MQLELSHKEAKSLFGALVDEDLPVREEGRLRTHLEACGDCRQGWERYHRAVGAVRRVEREKAPPHLSSNILRRVRRKKGPRALHLAHAYNRVPVEAIIPVLLGALVAAMLVFLAPQ